MPRVVQVAKGERLLKDVYQALRAGPKWQQTLLFVAYDDGGGYYDHIVPPFEGVPADESPCHVAGTRNTTACGPAFDFRRLGLRSGAMLISPLVERGSVFQEPRGPFATSQFELTSVPATIKRLFNLSSFLTKRDAWAGSFDELLADRPRQDTPLHLPEPPEPSSPWVPAPPRSGAESKPEARHCSAQDRAEPGACQGARATLPTPTSQLTRSGAPTLAGAGAPNAKQLKQIRLLSALTERPMPDTEAMSFGAANQWLIDHFARWMAA